MIFSEWSKSSSRSAAVEPEEAVVGRLALVDLVGHLAQAPVGLVQDLAARLELRLDVGGDLVALLVPGLRVEHQDHLVGEVAKAAGDYSGLGGRGAGRGRCRRGSTGHGRHERELAAGGAARCGLAVAAVAALALLPSLLRTPEPPPLDPDVGLTGFADAAPAAGGGPRRRSTRSERPRVAAAERREEGAGDRQRERRRRTSGGDGAGGMRTRGRETTQSRCRPPCRPRCRPPRPRASSPAPPPAAPPPPPAPVPAPAPAPHRRRRSPPARLPVSGSSDPERRGRAGDIASPQRP